VCAGARLERNKQPREGGAELEAARRGAAGAVQRVRRARVGERHERFARRHGLRAEVDGELVEALTGGVLGEYSEDR